MSEDARIPTDGPLVGGAAGAPAGEPEAHGREAWGSRTGFVLAAVGSAVGLGNMWRFPYITAESGGAAFVVLYILLIFLVGIPVLLAEFTLGRRTRLSPVGALRKTGGRGWSVLGYVFVAAGFLILSYYSVIAGWVTRYMLTGIVSGFAADPAAQFGIVSTGFEPVLYHMVFMIITIAIVMGGIEKGIERASYVMMPSLFLVIAVLAVWAFTLEGSGDGYGFYLAPGFDELFRFDTLANAAGQAFFSLSLGMGAMLTFSSYLSKRENLPREAATIASTDFAVAFLAGLVVFPIIFALGLQGSVDESPVGALFIALPGAFVQLGIVGRVVGSLFFIALFVGAVTSAISLLEVVTSSVIDELGISRKAAATGAGGIIAVLGILPALQLDALTVMDTIASNVLLPLGGLLLAVFVGWIVTRPKAELLEGASERMLPWIGGWLWLLRVLVPVALVVVLWVTIQQAWADLMGVFG